MFDAKKYLSSAILEVYTHHIIALNVPYVKEKGTKNYTIRRIFPIEFYNTI